jgi:signal transduction histidine kinase
VAVAVLSLWSLVTDFPSAVAAAANVATPAAYLPIVGLVLLTLGPLLATVRCWQGAATTLAGACFELAVPASPALFFLAVIVLVAAFAGSRRVSTAVLVAVLAWLTINAALIPQDYLIINVVLAIVVALLFGICRAGVRSREQLAESTAANTQAQLDHAELMAASRRQMTRDLHDVIAHDVTIIALQADAALSTAEPERQRQSLEAISEAAHTALADLRSMMRVLSPPSATPPRPVEVSLAKSVTSIAGHLRRLGYPVTVAIDGSLDALPASIQLGFLPVLRECGTNIVVHAAPGAGVDIRIAAGKAALDLRIANGAQASGHAPRIPNSGFGLGFMHERVERLGGTLTAEIVGTQWVVTAQVPFDAARVPPS